MTNLPITNSAPQTASVTRQATNASDTGDAQNAQPFGEVLARQINEPNAKDAKTDSKLASDVLNQLGADTKVEKTDTVDPAKTDAIPVSNTTTLPADMLAALLPQVMNAATASPTTPVDSKTNSPTVSAGAALDKRGIALQKTDVTTGIQTDLTAKVSPDANPSTQVKPQTFAAALSESALRTATLSEMNASAREAASIVAANAPQPNAAALAAMQNSAANIASAVAQPVQVTINTAVTQDKWADEFSQKITWLASSNKDQSAELHLNPPQLGPLDVVIKVSGDQATALFTSPHAAVRDAIEQAMPRLRDMLAGNGIMLGNATVSDQAPRDQGQSGTQRANTSSINDIRDTSTASNTASRVSQISRHNGIVDTFA
jgi:flagellar hook-length control protein FliK